jgi:WD40 repeat protein
LVKIYLPDPGRQDVRGFEWFYYWRLAHAERLTLAGQEGLITCVAVSPDGKLIASGSTGRETGSVILWDTATGARKRELTLRAISGVAFSPDGEALAVFNANGVHLWDLATYKSHALSAAREAVTCMAFAPRGATLATATPLGAVKMWDVKTWDVKMRKQSLSFPTQETGIRTMAFSHNGKTLATGSIDGKVRLWEVPLTPIPSLPVGEGEAVRRPRAELQGHPASVTALAFSSNDTSLATASQDGTVYVWDPASGKCRAGPFHPHQGDITALAFTVDDKALITGGTDQTVRVSDAATGQMNLVFKGHERAVTCLALTEQGKTLVTGSQDETVRVWDMTAGPRQATVLPRPPGAALCVAWSPDGQTLACGGETRAGGSIGMVELWNPAKKTKVMWRGHDNSVTDVAFSPGGKVLATASNDRKVRLWDVAKGDVAKGQLLSTLQGHDGSVGCLAFSRDGKWLASGDVDGVVILWDRSARKQPKRLQGNRSPVRRLAFSPDGATLAAGHQDGNVFLLDVDEDKVRVRWEAHPNKGIYGLSFSPDGATLATGSEDRTAKLWDSAAQRELASFTNHEMGVRSLTFAPDGRTLVTAAASSVRLWDVATGLERAVLRPETNSVLCVAFSRDGRRLAAATSNGPVVVWEGATDEELQAAGAK